MKYGRTIAAIAAFASVFSIGGAALAVPGQAPTTGKIPGHVKPQVKSESDQYMQQGLTLLQTAASDLQGGNASGAGASLSQAVSTMGQAKGIYGGWRERSIHAANNAIKALGINKPKALERAGTEIGKAISDAQQALQVD